MGSHGTMDYKAVPPGLRNSRLELEKLQQFEDEAKQEKIGGWGVNAGRLNAHAQKPASFSVFVAEKNARARTLPPANTFSRISATPPPLSPSAATVGPVEVNGSHAKANIASLAKSTSTPRQRKELKMMPGIGPCYGCSNYCRATISKC